MLKPPIVRNAEKEGLEVRRQGEWFAVPVRIQTKQLMRDVRRGVAVRGQDHVLGRKGHHRLKTCRNLQIWTGKRPGFCARYDAPYERRAPDARSSRVVSHRP
jgi:hypothetical protein